MNCLTKSYETAIELRNTGHTVLIAHALRGDGQQVHAFNIDVCCGKVVDKSDANPVYKDNHNLIMDFDEYMKDMKIDTGNIFGFKTYTFKDYNKKVYSEGNGQHAFWDLKVFIEGKGYQSVC